MAEQVTIRILQTCERPITLADDTTEVRTMKEATVQSVDTVSAEVLVNLGLAVLS